MMEFLGPVSSVLSWLPLQALSSFGDEVSAKSSEVGRRGDVGGREVGGGT
jgi:hypothetical protein